MANQKEQAIRNEPNSSSDEKSNDTAVSEPTNSGELQGDGRQPAFADEHDKSRGAQRVQPSPDRPSRKHFRELVPTPYARAAFAEFNFDETRPQPSEFFQFRDREFAKYGVL